MYGYFYNGNTVNYYYSIITDEIYYYFVHDSGHEGNEAQTVGIYRGLTLEQFIHVCREDENGQLHKEFR